MPEDPVSFMSDFLQKKSVEKAIEDKIKAEQKVQQALLEQQKYKTADKKAKRSEAKQ